MQVSFEVLIKDTFSPLFGAHFLYLRYALWLNLMGQEQPGADRFLDCV